MSIGNLSVQSSCGAPAGPGTGRGARLRLRLRLRHRGLARLPPSSKLHFRAPEPKFEVREGKRKGCIKRY